jgi:hypothetical protein
MKTLMTLAAFLLLLPAAAQAQNYTGSLEFSLGLANSAEADFDDPLPGVDNPVENDVSAMLSITPGLDRMLGKSVGIGLELGFIWLGNDDDAKDKDGEDLGRILVLNPNVRLSMNFPIVKGVTLSAMIAGGPAFWTGNDSGIDNDPLDSTRVGYGFRFNFGGGYQINKTVNAFMTIGYYTTGSFGDDVTVSQSSIPVNLGLRSVF